MKNKSLLFKNVMQLLLFGVLFYIVYIYTTGSLLTPAFKHDMYAMYIMPIKNHSILFMLYVAVALFFFGINFKKKNERKCYIVAGISFLLLLLSLYTIGEITFLNENTIVSSIFFVVNLIFLTTALFFLTYLNKLNVYSFYFATIIPLGIIFYFVFLPWSVPDAVRHMAATYRFSNIVLQQDEWSARKSDDDFFKNVWLEHKYKNPSKTGYNDILSQINQKVDNETIKEVSIKDEAMKCYSFVSYMPLIIGIVMGRIFNFNTVWMLYLAKLSMFLLYVSGIFLAIRTIPKLKYIMAMMAMLPISLMYTSGFSYDGMVIIVSFNFIASVLALHEKYSRHQAIMLLVWSFLLPAVKGGGYIILLPLIFILKNYKLNLMVLITACVSLLLFSDFLYTDKPMFQFEYLEEGYLSTSFALEHPLQYLRMAVLMYVKRFDYILYTMLGARLGWPILSAVEPTIEPFFVVMMFVLMLFACVKDEETTHEGIKYNTGLIVTLFLGCLSIPLLLLRETKIGADVVFGIQGRYYLPLLPIFMLLISSIAKKLPLKISAIIKKIDMKTILFLYTCIAYICVYCMLVTFLRTI